MLQKQPFTYEQARKLLFFFIRHASTPGIFGLDVYRVPIGSEVFPDDSFIEATLRDRGFPWDQTIEDLQTNAHTAIPWFENLIGGQSHVFVPGSESAHANQVTVSNMVNGIIVDEYTVTKHAEVGISFILLFEAACKARDRCIESGDVEEALTMVAKYFSALEALLNVMAHVWNEKNPELPPLADGPKRFVSTVEKIKKWVPQATGLSIDTVNSAAWAVFLEMKDIRDNSATHPKIGARPRTHEEAADILNRFRELAGLFLVIESAFTGQVSAAVIRANCYPTIKVNG